MIRSRTLFLVPLGVVIAAGLATRLFRGSVADALGDGLWTVMVYLLIRLMFPRKGPGLACALSIAISYLVEFQQLYRAEWILQLRATTLGHLILGSDFAWRDLPSYLAGGLTAFAVEKSWRP